MKNISKTTALLVTILFLGCYMEGSWNPKHSYCSELADQLEPATFNIPRVLLKVADSVLNRMNSMDLDMVKQYHTDLKTGTEIKSLTNILTAQTSVLPEYQRSFIRLVQASPNNCQGSVGQTFDNYQSVSGMSGEMQSIMQVIFLGISDKIIQIGSVSVGNTRLKWEERYFDGYPFEPAAATYEVLTRADYNRDTDYRGDGSGSVESGFFTRGGDSGGTGRGTSSGGTTGGSGRGGGSGTGRGTCNSDSGSSDEDNTGNDSDDGRIIITADLIEGWVVLPNTLLEKLIPESVTLEEGTILEPIHNPTLERPVYVGNTFDDSVAYDMPLQIIEP